MKMFVLEIRRNAGSFFSTHFGVEIEAENTPVAITNTDPGSYIRTDNRTLKKKEILATVPTSRTVITHTTVRMVSTVVAIKSNPDGVRR